MDVSLKRSELANFYQVLSILIGGILLPLALALLWKNERRLVAVAEFVAKAQAELRPVTLEKPLDENEFSLVSGSGETENRQPIDDLEFGASVENSYRLIRKVEMYQWVETVTTEKQGEETRTVFNYHQEWVGYPVNAIEFHDYHDHWNPTNEWPFSAQTIEANNVSLGGFRLDSEQC